MLIIRIILENIQIVSKFKILIFSFSNNYLYKYYNNFNFINFSLNYLYLLFLFCNIYFKNFYFINFFTYFILFY